jgi:glucosamine-6-phosphate deaminase
VNVCTYTDADLANTAAANLLGQWLTAPDTHNVMIAAGNSPLALYGRIADRRLALSHLTVFSLDEYVGVPLEEPLNCANLLRRHVIDAWRIPAARYFTVSSLEETAPASLRVHEQRIAEAGGLDVVVLGVGQNGHLGFNEPGSTADSPARVVELAHSSIEANRQWFGADYAPAYGATVGLRTILAARRVLVLAFGSHKAAAVKAMVEGPATEQCPASFLQNHANTWLFLDAAASAGLSARRQPDGLDA